MVQQSWKFQIRMSVGVAVGEDQCSDKHTEGVDTQVLTETCASA